MSHNCTRDTAPTWGMLALASTHGSHFVAPELSSGGFSGDSDGKESTCQCRRCKRLRFNPWVGKIPWRKKQKPTPVFLPGKFRGQRSLAGYSPRGHKESDTTEQLNNKSVTWEHSVSRPWTAARTPLSRNAWCCPMCLLRCLSSILLRESMA